MSPLFLKHVKAVGAVGAALALFAGPLAYAAQDPFLEHNTQRSFRPYAPFSPACSVTVQHGNIFAAAYSKIKSNSSSCRQIRVTVTALKDGQLVSSDTGVINNPVTGRWYQATVNFSNIVGSRFQVADPNLGIRVFPFRGI
ncbi:MAG TPA: hypothetical protein VK539_02555 [Myxococcaceae bacterium]|nr:hypothetical protein [Myxococcaceae bacterium]